MGAAMKRLLIVIAVVVLSLVVATPALAFDGSQVNFGKDIVVGPEQTIVGDVTAFGGNILIQGEVDGVVAAIGGDVTVSGTVTRDVTAIGGGVELQETARVGGGVVAVGGHVNKATGAVVSGRIIEGGDARAVGLPALPSLLTFERSANPVVGFVGAVLSVFALAIILLVVGVLALAIFPKQVAAMGQTLEQTPGRTIAVGVLTGILLPFGVIIATVILAVTVVGIAVIPFFWLGLMLASLYGLAGIGYAAGNRLLKAFGVREVVPLAAEIVGIAALVLVTVFPAAFLACLGVPWLYLVTSVGLAAVILSRFGTMIPRKKVTQSTPL
jgi:hypothetical protein